MFSELIVRAATQLDKDLPFVVYRRPSETVVHSVFQMDTHLHFVDDFSESGFVFAPFDSNKKAVLLPAHEVMSKTFVNKKKPGLKEVIAPPGQNNQHDFYVDLVERAISEIRSGVFKKVVLSRKLEQESSMLPLDLLQKILSVYDKAFCYLWYHPKVGLWLGATPEILLHSDGQQLTTMSLAGTKPYVSNKPPIWGDKEKEEQNMVTDYIVSAIKTRVKDLKVSETKAVRAGNLWHLRTEVSGSLKKEGLSEIIGVLHPTPAVCGVPLAPTKAFVLENEKYDREFYTGFIGELNRQEKFFESHGKAEQTPSDGTGTKKITELFVNLRCLQLINTTAQIYVGGGVTLDSVAEKEWQETVSKSKTMLRVLADK